ncbi:PKD domain-containing protein [Kitasatospora purpeofusca]|uniref:PKD domain-containing protein n=1 Tax=Kitasatospora purpeofusca TaxID=67352 RepID=UPI0030EFE295
MRPRLAFGLTVAAATAALGLPVPATAAPASTATTLHVSKYTYGCTDQGPGTVTQPFCTVSAAAAVVEPGQTVQVAPGDYPEQVRITRSGTPDKPITFVGGLPDVAPFGVMPFVRGSADSASFVLSGVHDVAVRGFRTFSARGVQVLGSSRVTLDRNWYDRSSNRESLHVGEGSDHVTVSRSVFNHSYGMVVDGGAHDILVSGNDFNRTETTGLTATGVADLAVTQNTFALNCSGSVLVDGDSPRAVVKNNIAVDGNEKSLQADRTYCSPFGNGAAARITVSAAAAPTATVDYNVVHAKSGYQLYKWAGTGYTSGTAFTSATGQGTHDLDLDVEYSASTYERPFDRLTDAAAGAIDSADPTAPGVDSDILGQPAIDHPQIAGTGPGTRDRGAYEISGMTGKTSLKVTGADTPTPKGPSPLTVVARLGFQNAWNTDAGSYLVDFGDGSEPVRTTEPTVRHTYTLPPSSPSNFFTVTAVAVDATGGRSEAATASDVMANPSFPLSGFVTATTVSWPYAFRFDVRSMSPYALTTGTIDFGDGTVADVPPNADHVDHTYAAPGSYTVIYTSRDEAQESASRVDVEVLLDASAAVLKYGERVQVLATGSSSLLNGGAHYGYGVWAPFTSVPAADRPFAESAVTGTAAGTTWDGVVHNVVSADGRIHIADRRMSDGGWTSWGEITANGVAGPLPGVPTQIAAAAQGSRLHVLALVDGRVYQATGDWEEGTWSGWGDVSAASGLLPASRIAATAYGSSLHVVALGTDGRVYDATGDYAVGAWTVNDPTSLIGLPPGAPISQLSATVVGSTLHILAVTGNRLHQASNNLYRGGWTGWGNITGATGDIGPIDRVSAVGIGNRLHVFTLAGGTLREAIGDYGRLSWTGWGNVSAASGAPHLDELAVSAG